jgi:hypothetical protein
MRGWEVGMLALIPWLPAGQARMPALPCQVAVEIQVHVPFGRSALDWRLLTGEVERVWAPYGVTFCWSEGPSGCRGVAVRLRVLVAETIGAPAAPGRRPIVGQIRYGAAGPGTDIVLSAAGARDLVRQAGVGDRPLATWPSGIIDHFVPRVLGRALAHEIGHYLLGTPTHARTGLMAASFRPDDVTLGPTSRFRLSAAQAFTVRAGCVAPALMADGRAATAASVTSWQR